MRQLHRLLRDQLVCREDSQKERRQLKGLSGQEQEQEQEVLAQANGSLLAVVQL